MENFISNLLDLIDKYYHQKNIHRPNVSFRYNLFYHIGKVSTLNNEDRNSHLSCYQEYGPPVIWTGEMFNLNGKCNNFDMSPCHLNNNELKHNDNNNIYSERINKL